MKNQVVCGDALEVLKGMESESVDCVVTSPPYFQLRDYKVEGQIGLEATYQEFIGKLIEVFNEVKRVLKKEGTSFVNLGDSYASLGKLNGDIDGDNGMDINRGRGRIKKGSYPEKSLMLIPHRFAISMIDNGWRLRNCLPWIKPNAMPESVQDRWKKAHEYWFFFVKSKKYYFDLDAIRTPHKEVSIKRAEFEQGRNALGQNPSSMGEKYGRDKNNRDKKLDKYLSMPSRQVKLNPKGATPPDYLIVNTNCSEDDSVRNHYATYPQKLIYPFVVAGCPKGGTILDPFCGSGTTGVVALKNGRSFIGIDLNKEYCDLALSRLNSTTPPLW